MCRTYMIVSLSASARAWPEPFVVRPDDSTITYADLHAATGGIANLFVSLGIERKRPDRDAGR